MIKKIVEKKGMTINIMTRMRALNLDLSLNYDLRENTKKIDSEPYRPC